MKRIVLKSIELLNFKGIKEYRLEPGPSGVDIRGDNATGKTTLADAFQWLLFGKDSEGKADFEIKTLDESGEAQHGLEHSVEAVLEVDGTEKTFKKVYAEKWTKKRGQAQKTFTGHTTDHAIDGVPVSKSKFDAAIADLIDESTFKLLTNPFYFNSLHWKERRDVLISVCGDIAQEDIIASDPELAELPGMLEGRDIDSQQKVVAAQKKKVNDELEKIPVRIDEVNRSLPDVSGLDKGKIEVEIAKVEKDLNAAKLGLQGIKTGGRVAELTDEKNVINSNLHELELTHRASVQKTLSEVNDKIEDINLIKRQAEADAEGHLARAGRSEAEISDLKGKLEKLREQWAREDGRHFEVTVFDTCPSCGQSLPEEQVKAASEKAQSEFNEKKAKHLAHIDEEGKKLRKALERSEDELVGFKERHSESQKLADEAAVKLPDLEAKRNTLSATLNMVTPEQYELKKKIEAIEAELDKELSGSGEERAKLEGKIHDLSLSVSMLQGNLNDIENHATGEKRIKELKAEEKRLAAEYEKLEQTTFLIERFIVAKVNMLEKLINSRFLVAKFKLFEVQVNGGISETCETLVYGVPFGSGLNRGAQINVGLDIINTLSEHYGFRTPIFVDNAEAVTKLHPVDTQVIRLIVDERFKTLEVSNG